MSEGGEIQEESIETTGANQNRNVSPEQVRKKIELDLTPEQNSKNIERREIQASMERQGFQVFGENRLFKKGAVVLSVNNDNQICFYQTDAKTNTVKYNLSFPGDSRDGILNAEAVEDDGYVHTSVLHKDKVSIAGFGGQSNTERIKTRLSLLGKSNDTAILLSAGFVSDSVDKQLLKTDAHVAILNKPEGRVVYLGTSKGPSFNIPFKVSSCDGNNVVLETNGIRLVIDKTGEVVANSQKVTREITSSELGLKIPSYKLEGKDIDSLTEINGVPIEIIEIRMRPSGSVSDVDSKKEQNFSKTIRAFPYSHDGFISATEGFKDVLKRHNLESRELGIEHTRLAEELYFAMNFVEQGFGNEFIRGGKKYRVRAAHSGARGNNQLSPFYQNGLTGGVDGGSILNPKDGYGGTGIYTVEKLDDNGNVVGGEDGVLVFSDLHPQMIAEEGFYEGQVSLGLSPTKIANFFELKKSS